MPRQTSTLAGHFFTQKTSQYARASVRSIHEHKHSPRPHYYHVLPHQHLHRKGYTRARVAWTPAPAIALLLPRWRNRQAQPMIQLNQGEIVGVIILITLLIIGFIIQDRNNNG